MCPQGEPIEHAPDIGILVGGHSLALRGVSRHEAGPYVCLASNVEGEGSSPALNLLVNCEYGKVRGVDGRGEVRKGKEGIKRSERRMASWRREGRGRLRGEEGVVVEMERG